MRLKIIIGIVLLPLSFVAYWMVEPLSLYPFADNPLSSSQNEDQLHCNELNGYSVTADSIINSAINKNDFISISTGVYSENCGTWLSTAGVLSKKEKEKPTPTSLYRIASITKPMTSVAIFQLYEQGLIELDAPIQNYVPEFPKKEKGEITIRQLLNHTSGIPYYKNFEQIHFTRYTDCIDALDKFKGKTLAFTPGSSFLYSSYGYTLLGALIEKQTGLSYQDYMKKNIWEPAGMKHTDIEDSDVEYNDKAGIYMKFGNSFFRAPKNDLSHTYSGGGLQTTSTDLLKFGEAILNYQLLSPKTTKLMIQLSQEDPTKRKNNLGWYKWITDEQGKVIEHHGKQLGCSSFFRIFYDKKVVVTALANSMNSRDEVRNLGIELSYSLLELEAERENDEQVSSMQDQDRFMFFLHNRFLENHGLQEVHPEYGRCEYKEIIAAFENKGFNVLSEKREGEVDVRAYASGITKQIDSLIQIGIKPNQITVVGTSKGGYIAQYVSTLARNPELNFVFVACYQDSDIQNHPDINFCGNILTIYDKSDTYGVSAAERKLTSTCNIQDFKEIEINTGMGHGFLFKPMEEWIEPTIKWGLKF